MIAAILEDNVPDSRYSFGCMAIKPVQEFRRSLLKNVEGLMRRSVRFPGFDLGFAMQV